MTLREKFDVVEFWTKVERARLLKTMVDTSPLFKTTKSNFLYKKWKKAVCSFLLFHSFGKKQKSNLLLIALFLEQKRETLLETLFFIERANCS